MASEGSITRILSHLDDDVASDDQRHAQQDLWDRFFGQLVDVARWKLGSGPRRAADEEDVVLSAMESFYAGAAKGRFPELRDRNGLWPLLVKITARKAFNAARKERAQKRGGGAVRGDSVCLDDAGARFGGGMAELAVSDEPTPEFAVEVAEQCRQLLDSLPDEQRRIAELKLQGHTTSEVAESLKISPRTIERRLQSIRSAWSE